ncbi:hypothetical protein [Tenacibaculum xiamenense]|uniref:hypothetical protein n=1 Tax=Tenacibaculum xiamenense TaxID=1261553 RepID=UPI0038941A3F
MIHVKVQSKIALVYFLLIAILGVLLRFSSVLYVNFNYRHIVHAHSHVALLGWGYTGIMLLVYHLLLKNEVIKKKYQLVFGITQISIIGMLVTFPITGYAPYSILFSTLFIIASYFFSYLVFKYTPIALKKTYYYKCIRIALWYMIISSIGPWALGIIMNTLGATSSWYRNAIYFYLHFQYNGWFILGLFGILFYIFERLNIRISSKVFELFFNLFNLGVLFSFAISILWMKLHIAVNIIGGLGAILQIVAFGFLIKEAKRAIKVKKVSFSNIFYLLLKILIITFVIKLLLQFIGVFPYFSKIISSNIDFVIGYLHWVFLGVVSLALLGFFQFFNMIKLNRFSVLLYLLAFVITEGLIFYKGITVWKNLYLITNFNYYLLIGSSIFLVALAYIFVLQYKKQISSLIGNY